MKSMMITHNSGDQVLINLEAVSYIYGTENHGGILVIVMINGQEILTNMPNTKDALQAIQADIDDMINH